MSNTTSASSTTIGIQRPVWILVAPGGHPSEFLDRDPASSQPKEDLWRWFAPDTPQDDGTDQGAQRRKWLQSNGWTIQAGTLAQFFSGQPFSVHMPASA
ncbi:hypothetical protein [Mycobacteroides abscessus]|uniref:hypothetical protein n=1 Tax=Mycobacteroides abscessus TaxID=36809 RepID=UPI0009A7A2E7|nr:hypothetical protein [Mycobacteroides abscessus]SLH38573.1 Uncharacterised protein [Mycobacteroides abscessus subsp. massiliense]